MSADKPHDPYMVFENTMQRSAYVTASEAAIHGGFNRLASVLLACTAAYGLITGKLPESAAAGTLAAGHYLVARRHTRTEKKYDRETRHMSTIIAAAEPMTFWLEPPPFRQQLSRADYTTIGQVEVESLRDRRLTYGMTSLSMGTLAAVGFIANAPLVTVGAAFAAIVCAGTGKARHSRSHQPAEKLGAESTADFVARFKEGLLIARHPPNKEKLNQVLHD